MKDIFYKKSQAKNLLLFDIMLQKQIINFQRLQHWQLYKNQYLQQHQEYYFKSFVLERQKMLLKKFYKDSTPPLKSAKDFELSMIANIDQYRKQQSLVIAPDKKEIIHRRIKIQGIANDNARTRLLKDELYLNYNYNPFSFDSLEKKTYDKYDKHQEGLHAMKIDSIIDKLEQRVQDNQRSKNALKQTREKISDIKRNYERQSQKIVKNMDRQKQPKKPTIEEQEQEKAQINKKITFEEELSEWEIQRIVSLKQQNAYSWKNRKVNIFKLVRDDNSELSPFEQMMKQNFSFTSICQKPKVIKIPIFRDLSNMGRRILSDSYIGTQKVFDHILSHQLIFHLSDLNYENILNVATNRFTPTYLQRQINGTDEENKRRGDANDSQSEESDDKTDLLLQRIQICKQTNYGAIDLQAKQIQDFKKVKYSSDEQNLAQTCQTQIHKAIAELNSQKQLALHGIRDKKLHFSKTQNLEKSIKMFNKLGVQKKSKELDMDAIVRMNKWNKDRKELIKIKKFGGMLKKKNEMNRVNKAIMRQDLIKNKENIHIEQQ